MKTMRDYTAELGAKIKTTPTLCREINMDMIEGALKGKIEWMYELGRKCLWEAANWYQSNLEAKKEFAELGLYWLNEVTLLDDGNIGPYGQLSHQRYATIAMAYIHLFSVYCNVDVPEDVPPRGLLDDVIPEDKSKAMRYLWHGAKYSEYCAIEWVMTYLKGEMVEANVETAHDYLLRFLEATKNTPRFNRAEKTPFFLLKYEDYDYYNVLAVEFQLNGAYKYAFELLNVILSLIENEKNWDLTPAKVPYSWVIYYNLALSYCDSLGVIADKEKAKELYAKAKQLFEEESPNGDFLKEDKQSDNLAEKLGLL